MFLFYKDTKNCFDGLIDLQRKQRLNFLSSHKQPLHLIHMEIFEGKTATISMISHNIMLAVMKENVEVDVAAIAENYEIAMRLAKGERYVSLVDARKKATLTVEARKVAANPEIYKLVIAQAIVIKSVVTRLLANFTLNFTQQNKNVEMKIFNDYDEALTWLKGKLLEEQAALAMEKFRNKLKG
jgi:hypothetical protein